MNIISADGVTVVWPDIRPSWDEYFMRIAHDVSQRATCPRRSVGAVLVRDHHMLAAGYNGSPRGTPHCTDVGCLVLEEGGGCQRTIHAETNAILQAARHGVSTLGSTLYVTVSPCMSCFKTIIAAGVVEVVYFQAYRESNFELLAQAGVKVRKYQP